jgi:hypothetical protein
MTTVEEINAELDFALHAPDLKKVEGVWKSLMALQTRAKRDPKLRKQYRTMLERCIKQLLNADPELSPDDASVAADKFNEWLVSRRRELEIGKREAGRQPSPAEAWCEKNLPREYTNVTIALNAACERTTQRTLDNLRRAYDDMLDKYINAV